MKKKYLVFLLFTLMVLPLFGQTEQDSLKDTSRRTLRYVNPAPDLSTEEFIICERTQVFLYKDSVINDITYLRKNFTDQFLQVCYNKRMYPASRIWGFNMGGKYFRAGHTYDYNYVFAERILSGHYSLFYCRNLPNIYGEIEYISTDPANPDYRNRMIIEDDNKRRFRNDYNYFISPSSDSSKMIYVNNKNIKAVAETYFVDCKPAYNYAKAFHNKYRLIQTITLPVGVGAYLYSVLNGPGLNPVNYKSPFFYIGVGSIATYIYTRIKAKNKYLHPDDMMRIVSSYNDCHRK
jgi:hypothetical protein